MENENESSNVLAFPGVEQRQEAKLSVRTVRREGFCSHVNTLLREKDRVLVCADCDQVIAPFDWLWQQATNEKRCGWLVQDLAKESKKLRASIDDLKRDEKNIKARIKRALKK